jgi:CubicO group peptidase (beta-lactamase class C family)/sugar lactone lactonase YvrE
MFTFAIVRLILVLVAFLAGSSVPQAAAQIAPGERTAWPTAGWSTAAPEEQGMDPALLARVSQRVPAELSLLSAVVVVRGGEIVFEDYYNGQVADEPIHLWSVTKSVTSMAIGMAVDEGLLRLDQTLGELIPERIPAGADPRTASVTVEQLLTMTSGWVWDSPTDFLHLDDAPDWAARTLGLPMACDPGACYAYNSGNAHLLSVILQTVTGQTEADFLQSRLFDPLGIVRPTWRQSPQGETAGAFGLELNARAAAKLGYLALNQGVWDGQQIVPAEWIATSTAQHSSGTNADGTNFGNASYGYLWWVTETVGYPAYFALGYGAQVIYVVPGLDLVTVAVIAEPNAELQQDPIPLIGELIVAAALAGPSAASAAEPLVAQVTPAPAASPAAAAATAAATPITGGGRVFALPTGGGGFPEGIAFDAATGDFYVGSTIDGTIYRGNVETGTVGVFLPGQPGRVSLGLALDGRGRLFVAGGQTGAIAVYDTRTGQLLLEAANGLAPNTFLNDVAVSPTGDAYFTDSFNPLLYRIPATAIPRGLGTPAPAPTTDALEVVVDFTATGVNLAQPGFNANGIVATPDGRYLLLVQTNTGALFRVDTTTGQTIQVDLGSGSLPGGDGLALDGQTLYVVHEGQITVVVLEADYASGTVGESFSDPSFAVPTTLERFDGCLLVVNSQLDALQGQPQLPFTVSSVPIPVEGSATPAATVRC